MVLDNTNLYLGFDLSTQKLKICVINDALEPVYDIEVSFDLNFPKYNTINGALWSTISDGNGQNLKCLDKSLVSCPTLLWVEALDLVLQRALDAKVNFANIKAISGCAQQHGSVYWKPNISELHKRPALDSGKPLAQQLEHEFSRKTSPIWLDSSTGLECDELATCVGKNACFLLDHDVATIESSVQKTIGERVLAAITGSQAQERFTLPQIMKISRTEPQVFAETGKISCVSNFLATLLMYPQRYAPLDYTEGSGTNLMDLRCKVWSSFIINALTRSSPYPIQQILNKLSVMEDREDGDLPQPAILSRDAGARDLDYLVPSPTFIGNVSDYLVSRYNFDPGCQVTAFVGDNAASLLGSCATSTDLLISLGTSDTAFFWTKAGPQPRLDHIVNGILGQRGLVSRRPSPIDRAHLFANPISPFSHYLTLVCYRNGSSTRENVLRQAAARASSKDHTKQYHPDLPTSRALWKLFDTRMTESEPGNGGTIGLYYTVPEITPHVFAVAGRDWAPRVMRFDQNGEPIEGRALTFGQEARALIEGRFLAMRNHVQEFCANEQLAAAAAEASQPDCPSTGGDPLGDDKSIIRSKFRRIIVSGGAACNLQILKVMADVLGLPVYVTAMADAKGPGKKVSLVKDLNQLLAEQGKKPVTNTAALGSAYLAKYTLILDERLKRSDAKGSSSADFHSLSYENIYRDMIKETQSPFLVFEPDLELTDGVYERMANRYKALEADFTSLPQ